MSSRADLAEVEGFRPPEPTGLAFAVGFYFSFRAVIVLLSVRVRGAEPRTGAEISVIIGFLLLLLACFHSLGFAGRTFRSMLRLPSVRWVLAFLVFSCCSLLWSETASLSTSLVYWMGMVADVATVVLLLRAGPVEDVSDSLMKGFLWSACCLAMVAWVMPTQSDLRLGDEEFFNTNQIGNLCAVAIFFAQYLMRRQKGKWTLAIFFLAVTLFRSLSKTTLVAFLVSESFLIIQDRALSRRTKIFLTIVAALLVFIFWGLFEAYYDIYTTAGNQAETLTGRTAIWLYVLHAVSDHSWNLWIGHGLDSWWKVVPPFGSGQFEARHAENELLQQFYAYGAAGVVMLIGLYGSLYRQIRKLPRAHAKILFLSILLYVLVRGLAEAESFDFLLPLWTIVLIGELANCKEAETRKIVAVPSLASPDVQRYTDGQLKWILDYGIKPSGMPGSNRSPRRPRSEQALDCAD